jgi:hypothetical protein
VGDWEWHWEDGEEDGLSRCQLYGCIINLEGVQQMILMHNIKANYI